MESNIGKHLEMIRKERGFSLRKAESKSGLSFSYIRDLEMGMNRSTKKKVQPSAESLKKLADAYDVDYFELLILSGIVTEDKLLDAKKKANKVLSELVEPNPKIPLLGTICAGEGLLAEQNIDEYLSYPYPHKRQPDYALRVKGDSMVDACIEDGDIVYLRKARWAEHSGQIVAVIINDGQEGTLKRMKWSGGSPAIQLVPENSKYSTIEVQPYEILVCGVYMGHFKPEEIEER